ncbi:MULTISPECIES: YnfU family zinc-binding protein [Enterobacterales]|uniref:YnfU family zinc-binding protein n=1 Tax=Enterobacterales TaxID=91347 RepID=UPI002ED9BABA
MSWFDNALKFIGNTANTTVTCPECGAKSTQPSSKIRLRQAILCPGCKALFVVPR